MPNKCLKKNSSRFAQMRQWKKNYNFVSPSLLASIKKIKIKKKLKSMKKGIVG